MRVVATLAFVALTCSGCMTSYVRSGNYDDVCLPRAYPATTYDCIVVTSPFWTWFVRDTGPDAAYADTARLCLAPLLICIGIIDLPFALLTDTVMLPFDLRKDVAKDEKNENRNQQDEPTEPSEAAPSASSNGR